MSILDNAPKVPLAEVEWRLDSEPKEGHGGTRARYVPHINARIAAALMDEWVGPLAWSDEYRTVTIAGKEALLCTVSVWNGERWVAKQDVGVPSHTEPQKGAVSDAFKRTVTVKWGAGRNVYELPTLWAPCKAVTSGGKTRWYPTDATLPDILRQLKAKGFTDAAGRLEESDENAGAERAEGDRNSFAGPRSTETSAAPTRATSSDPAPASPARPREPEEVPSPATSSGSPFIPPQATLDKYNARAAALAAAKVNILAARTEQKLPPLSKITEEWEWIAWGELLTNLEVAEEEKARRAS